MSLAALKRGSKINVPFRQSVMALRRSSQVLRRSILLPGGDDESSSDDGSDDEENVNYSAIMDLFFDAEKKASIVDSKHAGQQALSGGLLTYPLPHHIYLKHIRKSGFVRTVIQRSKFTLREMSAEERLTKGLTIHNIPIRTMLAEDATNTDPILSYRATFGKNIYTLKTEDDAMLFDESRVFFEYSRPVSYFPINLRNIGILVIALSMFLCTAYVIKTSLKQRYEENKMTILYALAMLVVDTFLLEVVFTFLMAVVMTMRGCSSNTNLSWARTRIEEADETLERHYVLQEMGYTDRLPYTAEWEYKGLGDNWYQRIVSKFDHKKIMEDKLGASKVGTQLVFLMICALTIINVHSDVHTSYLFKMSIFHELGLENKLEHPAVVVDDLWNFLKNDYLPFARTQGTSMSVFTMVKQIRVKPVANRPPKVQTFCRDKELSFGIYAHPYICSKFLQCSQMNTFVTSCPGSLVYNPHLRTCVFADQFDCDSESGAGTASCDDSGYPSWQSNGNSCYQPISNDTIERTDFCRDWRTKKADTDDDCLDIFGFKPHEPETFLELLVDDYPYGGYGSVLTKKVQKNIDMIENMETLEWVDEYTRAVIIDATILDRTTGTAAALVIEYNFQPNGIRLSYKCYPFAFIFQTVFEWILYVALLVWAILTLVEATKHISKLASVGIKEYLMKIENIVKLINLMTYIVVLTAFGYRFYLTKIKYDLYLKTLFGSDGPAYISLKDISLIVIYLNSISGFLALAALLQFLDTIRRVDRFYVLVQMIRQVFFLSIFPAIIISPIAFCLFVRYSSYSYNMSTYRLAIYSVVEYILKSKNLYLGYPYMEKVLGLCLWAIFFIVIGNGFLVALNEEYSMLLMEKSTNKARAEKARQKLLAVGKSAGGRTDTVDSAHQDDQALLIASTRGM